MLFGITEVGHFGVATVSGDLQQNQGNPEFMANVQDVELLRKLEALLNLPDLPRIADIGANPMNHAAPYADFLKHGFCTVTGFEPQEDTMRELIEQKSDLETYLPDAVGDGETHTLNLYRGFGLASIFTIRGQTLGYLRGLRRAARPQGTVNIKTSRLDDISEVGRVDLLKIDIQGGELSVFENGARTLGSVLAVQTEVNFFPLYDDQPGFGEIDVCLRQFGLVPHSFQHIEKRIVLSKWGSAMNNRHAAQMLDGDILYLRDLSKPDALSSHDLGRMALISAGVYGLTDVTLRCLELLQMRAEIEEADLEAYLEGLDLESLQAG